MLWVTLVKPVGSGGFRSGQALAHCPGVCPGLVSMCCEENVGVFFTLVKITFLMSVLESGSSTWEAVPQEGSPVRVVCFSSLLDAASGERECQSPHLEAARVSAKGLAACSQALCFAISSLEPKLASCDIQCTNSKEREYT